VLIIFSSEVEMTTEWVDCESDNRFQ